MTNQQDTQTDDNEILDTFECVLCEYEWADKYMTEYDGIGPFHVWRVCPDCVKLIEQDKAAQLMINEEMI